MSERQRGILVTPMVDDEINGPIDRYALIVRPDGETRMVHYEGVSYLVTDEKPWRWTDYGDCPTWTPAELAFQAEGLPTVDLADWVRTFGARLESNFSQIVWWFNA